MTTELTLNNGVTPPSIGLGASGVDRDDVFLETKIWVSDFGYDDTLHAPRLRQGNPQTRRRHH